MATFQRSVTTDWEGGLMDGKGVAKAGTGAFSLPVTFPVRIGEPEGKTSPEELMAAAHARVRDGDAAALASAAACGDAHVTATVSGRQGDAGINRGVEAEAPSKVSKA